MKTEIEEAKTFWSQNSKDYETWWVSSNDRITFWSNDLWKFMNAYKNQSQPIEKEQEIERLRKLAIERFDYAKELQNNLADERREIERLKRLVNEGEFYYQEFEKLRIRIKELEAQLKEKDEALKYCHKRMADAYGELNNR